LPRVVLRKLFFDVRSVEQDFFEYSFIGVTNAPYRVYFVVVGDCDTGVADSFVSEFFGVMNVNELGAKPLHTNSISKNNAVTSACHEKIILFAPSNASNLPGVTRKGHSWRVFAGIELEHMNRGPGYSSKVMPTVGKLDL